MILREYCKIPTKSQYVYIGQKRITATAFAYLNEVYESPRRLLSTLQNPTVLKKVGARCIYIYIYIYIYAYVLRWIVLTQLSNGNNLYNMALC